MNWQLWSCTWTCSPNIWFAVQIFRQYLSQRHYYHPNRMSCFQVAEIINIRRNWTSRFSAQLRCSDRKCNHFCQTTWKLSKTILQLKNIFFESVSFLLIFIHVAVQPQGKSPTFVNIFILKNELFQSVISSFSNVIELVVDIFSYRTQISKWQKKGLFSI